jgi:hypothetical protein
MLSKDLSRPTDFYPVVKKEEDIRNRPTSLEEILALIARSD